MGIPLLHHDPEGTYLYEVHGDPVVTDPAAYYSFSKGPEAQVLEIIPCKHCGVLYASTLPRFQPPKVGSHF